MELFLPVRRIKLNEVDANTMQSKIVPHLFFAGEILNVDGITGGFNFQHAWTSVSTFLIMMACYIAVFS
jgi:predicted flavoprotein YhiN